MHPENPTPKNPVLSDLASLLPAVIPAESPAPLLMGFRTHIVPAGVLPEDTILLVNDLNVRPHPAFVPFVDMLIKDMTKHVGIPEALLEDLCRLEPPSVTHRRILEHAQTARLKFEDPFVGRPFLDFDWLFVGGKPSVREARKLIQAERNVLRAHERGDRRRAKYWEGQASKLARRFGSDYFPPIRWRHPVRISADLIS